MIGAVLLHGDGSFKRTVANGERDAGSRGLLDGLAGFVVGEASNHFSLNLEEGGREKYLFSSGICICYYTFWSGVADLSARHPRADKPQHHDKRCDKMFITVDWSLRGARFQIRICT